MSTLGETYENKTNKLGIINALRRKKDELEVKKKSKNKNAKHKRIRISPTEALEDAVRFSDLNDEQFSGESKIITWLKRKNYKRPSSPKSSSPSPHSSSTTSPQNPTPASAHRVRRKRRNKATRRISSRPFYSPPRRQALCAETIEHRRLKNNYPVNSLLGLPIEVCLLILLQLSPSQIATFSVLCTKSYFISKDGSVWRSLYNRYFPAPLCSSLLFCSDSSSSQSTQDASSPLEAGSPSSALSSNTNSNSNCSTGSSCFDHSTPLTCSSAELSQQPGIVDQDWKDKYISKVYKMSEVNKDWLTPFSSCNSIINPNAVSGADSNSDNTTTSCSTSTTSCSTSTNTGGTPSSHSSSSFSASSPSSFSFGNGHGTPLKANSPNNSAGSHPNEHFLFNDVGLLKTSSNDHTNHSTSNSTAFSQTPRVGSNNSKDSSSSSSFSPSPNGGSLFFPPHQIIEHNHKKDDDGNTNNAKNEYLSKEFRKDYDGNKEDMNIRRAPQINLLHTFKAHTGSISCVDFSKNLEILVSCAKDQTIRIASLPQPHHRGKFKVLKTLKPHTEKEISRVKIDESTFVPRLFSCAQDCTIRVHDLGTLVPTATLTGHDRKVWAVDVYQNVVVSGGGGGMIKIWDLRVGGSGISGSSGNVGAIKMEGNKSITIYDVIYDERENRIIAANGHPDNTIRVYDTRKCYSSILGEDHSGNNALMTMKGHKNYVFKIKRVGNNLVSGSGDGAIRIWDLKSNGECTRTLTRGGGGGMGAGGRFGGAGGMVLGLDADKTKIVSAGSGGGKINVWDMNKGEIVNKWEAHKDTVWSLKVEEDMLVTGSEDNAVKVWRMTGGEEVERKARRDLKRKEVRGRGIKIWKELLGPS